MTRGYNELVGIQVRCSRVVERYQVTHYYHWRVNGKTKSTGSMRSFDMHRHLSVHKIMRNLREVYAPAILSIWQQVTNVCVNEYFQFHIDACPSEIGLDGYWNHWAER